MSAGSHSPLLARVLRQRLCAWCCWRLVAAHRMWDSAETLQASEIHNLTMDRHRIQVELGIQQFFQFLHFSRNSHDRQPRLQRFFSVVCTEFCMVSSSYKLLRGWIEEVEWFYQIQLTPEKVLIIRNLNNIQMSMEKFTCTSKILFFSIKSRIFSRNAKIGNVNRFSTIWSSNCGTGGILGGRLNAIGFEFFLTILIFCGAATDGPDWLQDWDVKFFRISMETGSSSIWRLRFINSSFSVIL